MEAIVDNFQLAIQAANNGYVTIISYCRGQVIGQTFCNGCLQATKELV